MEFNIYFPLIVLFAVLIFHSVQCSPIERSDSAFNISVIHLNDFHARFEEVTDSSVTCKATDSSCIGGIARVYTVVTDLLQSRPNAVFLNAGDNFQGTLWYNIFKWNVTQEFLNKFPTDAYTLGNHEFDDAIAGVVPFIKSLNAPVVVANIDDSEEPDMQGLYNKSVIINKNGIRIGIIGVILQTTPSMASTENLIFLPESASVNEEADRLAAEGSVDTIIVVSHCGYDRDKTIARNATSKIGLIVGAHSHTFLYTGDNPPGPDTPAGDYPTVITHNDGRQVLIVQASAYTKYLGNITVYYNSDGDVVDWDGAPIYLDDSFEKNVQIEEELQPWKAVVDAYGDVIVGETLIDLPSGCYNGECIMGDLIADSYVYSYKGTGNPKYSAIGFINAGGVRAGLSIGNITYADAVTVQPFENTIDFGYLQGTYLLEAVKQTISDTLLQVSGIRVNYTSGSNTQVKSVEVMCTGCESPGYVLLDEDEEYVVVFPSFFKSAGRFNYLYTNISEYTIGVVDIEAFTEYLSVVSPISNVETGRLNYVSDEEDNEVEVTTEEGNGGAEVTTEVTEQTEEGNGGAEVTTEVTEQTEEGNGGAEVTTEVTEQTEEGNGETEVTTEVNEETSFSSRNIINSSCLLGVMMLLIQNVFVIT